MKIKALIFDFGGTIDTDGIHWVEKFWEKYHKYDIKITKGDFFNAYVFAEKNINNIINSQDSFLETLTKQVSLQFNFLIKNRLLEKKQEELIENIVNDCYDDVKKNIKKFYGFYGSLKEKYSLAIVSNFYGNLKCVLKEFNLHNFFNVVIDSSIINIRKPDEKIFKKTLDELKVKPNEVTVIGDSYKNDIEPAEKVGCNTIWLNNKSYFEEEKTNSMGNKYQADFEIKSLAEWNIHPELKKILMKS